LSQALPYNTVGEFFENSSEVKAYKSIAENPAPNNITVKFVDLAAALVTVESKNPSDVAKISEDGIRHTFAASA